jgi:hypothetical protein
MPWLSRSVSGLCLRRPGFDFRSIRVRFALDEVAPVQVLLRVLLFPLSMSLHQCSTLVTIYTSLLPENKLWKFSKNALSEMGEHRTEKRFRTFKASSRHCEERLLAPSCLSVCPHGTTRLSLQQFPCNLI